MKRVVMCVMGVAIVMVFRLGAVQNKESFSLQRLSRHCIKIWCMMSDLVEKEKLLLHIPEGDNSYDDCLDQIICALVRARDMIMQIQKGEPLDRAIAEYVETSLDCIESYSYDLVHYYPGSWSAVIQDQVMRAQVAYEQEIVPFVTR